MRSYARPLAMLLLAGLAGCSHRPFKPDPDSGAMAAHAYPYAIAALNSYPDEWVELPGLQLIEHCGNDRHGYAYSVMRLDGRNVLSFRGTEGPLFISRDWIHGNFGRAQQRQAVPTAARLTSAGGDWVFAGHSLGGALTYEASYYAHPLAAYAFNSSPRYRIGRGTLGETERYSIVERGEVLYATRFARWNTQQQYNSLNCLRGARPVRDHGMARLAACLTRIAAANGDPRAIALVRDMIKGRLRSDPTLRPRAECTEPGHAAL